MILICITEVMIFGFCALWWLCFLFLCWFVVVFFSAPFCSILHIILPVSAPVSSDIHPMDVTPPPSQIAILENVRFHKEEEKNDPEFAKAVRVCGVCDFI